MWITGKGVFIIFEDYSKTHSFTLQIAIIAFPQQKVKEETLAKFPLSVVKVNGHQLTT